MAAYDDSYKKRLDSFFNLYRLKFNPDTSDPKKIIQPDKMSFASRDPAARDVQKKLRYKLPRRHETVEDLLNYWYSACHDQQQDFRDRKMLWQDMQMITLNSPLLARAHDLTADEVVQADSNSQPLAIEGPADQRQFYMKHWDDIKIYPKIRPTAYETIQFGNHLWTLSLGKKGVEKVQPIDIEEFNDRMEFTPFKVKEMMESPGTMFRELMTNMQRMNALIQSILSEEDYSSYFTPILFGFQVGTYMIPPWRAIHFRNYTTKTAFHPFGMPVYIASVAPYRQFDAAMTLQIAARGARFPIDMYKLTLPNTLNPTDAFERVSEAMNEFLAGGFHTTKKEGIGVGEQIFTIDGMVAYEQISPQIDIGRIDDLDMLRDDLIVSTMLPRFFLDPSGDSFGQSGVALVQQWKPFARLVYRIQSIMMESFLQEMKIHAIQSGRYALSELDFELTMPYPESQTTPEVIQSQRDLLDLANNMLDGMATKVLGADASSDLLPIELIKKVYYQVLPYGHEKIDVMLDLLVKHREQKEKEAANTETGSEESDDNLQQFMSSNAISDDVKHKVRSKMLERKREQAQQKNKWREMKEFMRLPDFKKLVEEEAMSEARKMRKDFFREGTYGGKHRLSCRAQYSDFTAEKLIELDRLRMSKLKEGVEDVSENANEECEYIFNDPDKEKINERITKWEFREKHGRSNRFGRATKPATEEEADGTGEDEGDKRY